MKNIQEQITSIRWYFNLGRPLWSLSVFRLIGVYVFIYFLILSAKMQFLYLIWSTNCAYVSGVIRRNQLMSMDGRQRQPQVYPQCYGNFYSSFLKFRFTRCGINWKWLRPLDFLRVKRFFGCFSCRLVVLTYHCCFYNIQS